jgi:hypothetical protein
MTNLLTPLVNNQDLSAEFVNTTIDNMRSVKFLVADLPVNNTALLTTAAELALPVVANGKYVLNSCIFYDTSATADFKVAVFYPSGPAWITFWSSGTGITGASNSLDQSVQVGTNGDALAASCGGVAAGTVLAVRPAGYLEIGTASGLVSIGYAQVTPTATNSYLKQGSWISLTRVA